MSAGKSLLLLSLLGIGLGTWGVWAQDRGGPVAEKQRREEINKLIGQLSSDDFRVREEAVRRLKEMDDALPALREAAKSGDAEVAMRAREVIEASRKREAKREVGRAIALLKQGKTDQFVERAVRWRDDLDDDCWKAALEHAQAIADAAGKASGCKFKPLPRFGLAQLNSLPNTDFLMRKRLAAESVEVEFHIFDSFVICAGAVRAKSNLVRSIVFANGDIKLDDKNWLGGIGGSIVVCDGDVAVRGPVTGSVVLATGSVSVGAEVSNSVIVSGGKVKMGEVFPGARAQNSLIQEHRRDPLNFIRFFDPAQVGIEVKASPNGLRVERVVAAQPFGRAGICQGDRVLRVDGVSVDSPEAFRRVLRRRLGDANPVLLDVRREDKPLRIEVRGLAEVP